MMSIYGDDVISPCTCGDDAQNVTWSQKNIILTKDAGMLRRQAGTS